MNIKFKKWEMRENYNFQPNFPEFSSITEKLSSSNFSVNILKLPGTLKFPASPNNYYVIDIKKLFRSNMCKTLTFSLLILNRLLRVL